MPAIKTRTAPALYNALTILDLLAASRTGLTLLDLVEHANLAKSSVHYLLVTLERCGYVRRIERTGRYMLGVKLISMGNASLGNLGLRQRTASYLSWLKMSTGMTVHMAVYQNHEAILVARDEVQRSARLATWIGKRMSFHCTGIGKSILAFLPEREVNAIIRKNGLARHNENTIASYSRLLRELERVSKQGYALDNEEDELGVRCIGVPILGTGGLPLAAISIAGSSHELPLEEAPRLAINLQKTARMMTQAVIESTTNVLSVEPLADIAS
jgi:DNA-binding IclR family transcriptional regulator